MFSPLTSSAWMAGLVYEQVGKSFPKGTVTSDDVFNGLYTVKNLTAGGLLSGLTYTKNQKDRSVPCFWETKVHDGKWVAENGLKTTCTS